MSGLKGGRWGGDATLRGLLVPGRCAERCHHEGPDGTSTAAWPTEPVAYCAHNASPLTPIVTNSPLWFTHSRRRDGISRWSSTLAATHAVQRSRLPAPRTAL